MGTVVGGNCSCVDDIDIERDCSIAKGGDGNSTSRALQREDTVDIDDLMNPFNSFNLVSELRATEDAPSSSGITAVTSVKRQPQTKILPAVVMGPMQCSSRLSNSSVGSEISSGDTDEFYSCDGEDIDDDIAGTKILCVNDTIDSAAVATF